MKNAILIVVAGALCLCALCGAYALNEKILTPMSKNVVAVEDQEFNAAMDVWNSHKYDDGEKMLRGSLCPKAQMFSRARQAIEGTSLAASMRWPRKSIPEPIFTDVRSAMPPPSAFILFICVNLRSPQADRMEPPPPPRRHITKARTSGQRVHTRRLRRVD